MRRSLCSSRLAEVGSSLPRAELPTPAPAPPRASRRAGARLFPVAPGAGNALPYPKAQLDAAGIEEGVVFVQGTGTREAHWPELGVEAFTCTPLLESGDAFHLLNPTDTRTGLQTRHALQDASTARAYMRQVHPGTQAWIGTHDIARNQWRLEPLRVD